MNEELHRVIVEAKKDKRTPRFINTLSLELVL